MHGPRLEQYCLELIVWEMVAKSYHNHSAKGPDNDAGIGVIDPGMHLVQFHWQKRYLQNSGFEVNFITKLT